MPSDAPTGHVLLSKHPTHPSAVIATLTGTDTSLARALLHQHHFVPATEPTMLLARIDHEEGHYTEQAAHALRDEGIGVTLTADLKKDINTEWEWHGHPMPWLDSDEIRAVSHDAQEIHDAIRDGRLIIHAHAHDGWTTVAAGTYRDGKSIHLHGEDHVRVESTSYLTPREALTEFVRLYKDAARPGPAPLTDTERAAATALSEARLLPPVVLPSPTTETVPAYAAGPADHDALLDGFLDENKDWEKWRTWSDEATHAIHEEQTLRIELVHEPDAREAAWTVAAYETPVSDRTWYLTMTRDTPEPVVERLLGAVAYPKNLDPVVDQLSAGRALVKAVQPLKDAGWTDTVDTHNLTLVTPQGDAGVLFNFARTPDRPTNMTPWTFWGGDSITHPTWALHASANTPATLLADLAEELAHGSGTCLTPPAAPQHSAQPTPAPAPPPATTTHTAPRR